MMTLAGVQPQVWISIVGIAVAAAIAPRAALKPQRRAPAVVYKAAVSPKGLAMGFRVVENTWGKDNPRQANRCRFGLGPVLGTAVRFARRCGPRSSGYPRTAILPNLVP